MRDLKSITKRVQYILRKYPRTRRSDMELYIRYIERFGALGLTKYEERTLVKLMRKARLEHFPTIWRARQKEQSKNPSLFDGMTARKRRELEKEYRREFGRKGMK